MAKRAGPSISVKMILTSTLLVLLTVVGFGVLNVMNIRDVYDAQANDRVTLFREGLKERGAAATAALVSPLKNLLIDTRDNEIQALVREMAQTSEGLELVSIVSKKKTVIIHCRVIPADERKDQVACDESAYKEIHLPVTDEIWNKVAPTWDEQLTATATADVVLDRKDVAVYAFPIFLGTDPVTAQDAEDRRLGYVILGYDLSEIAAFTTRAEEEKEQASYEAAVKTGVVGALFVLIGTLLSIFQGLSVSKPIKLLAWKADQIARGDLEARVEVKSTDEIGILGENFNFMADQIVVLLHQTAEKAHMEKELEVARTIQETLVPPNEPVSKGNFKLAGYFQPASQCGGDWWTWHELVGERLLIVVGDVTGHGVPSAMITAAAKAACDVARSQYDDNVTASQLLEIMNYAIYESAKRKFVMTCFASIIDTKRRTITYANAGHNFPYLYRIGEDGKGEFGSLMIRGNRLGDLKESKYEEKTTDLIPGDLLVWYTDGIVECENVGGEEYGEKRFRASVRRAAAHDAGDIRDAVVADAGTFFGEALRKDDITLVIGKMH
jgi:serine phosphatase RsbU (regulator of sigma subunit)